jgi:hypothetical protein
MPTIIATLARTASTNRNERSNAGVSGPGHQSRMDTPPSEAAIWRRAYQKWEAAGNPAGDGVRFWWEAEREILQGK